MFVFISFVSVGAAAAGAATPLCVVSGALGPQETIRTAAEMNAKLRMCILRDLLQ
jgi:hypothetical protein